METTSAPRWLVRGASRSAQARLYCFPHGGGSAAEYAGWARHLTGIEVWAIQLPGRGTRFKEPAFTSMAQLVSALVEQVSFRAPFAFFGHSFGALVAYEVPRQLRRRNRQLPEHLVVSGYPAPHLPRVEQHVHELPDDQLLAEVGGRHGGLSEEVLTDPQLRALTVGCLRADYQIVETYVWQEDAALPMPITVFAGREDHIPPDELALWDRHTTGGVTVREFPGGHFYLREQRAATLRALAGVVRGMGR